MPMSLAEFTARRKDFTTQYFPCPDPTPRPPPTVMVCSHIWWTDQISLAFLNSGCNVLVHAPLYLLYTDEQIWAKFDEQWEGILAGIKQAKVDFIVGGNATAMAPHPQTGELLHNAAGVPVVHYWWDEPRTLPPFGKRCSTPEDYVGFMRDRRTLNVFWDLDVLEEMAAFFGVTNAVHVPLATLPEFWPGGRGFAPLEKRPLAACFLGNCHYTADWVETNDDALTAWARGVTARKIASPDTSMKDAIEAMGKPPVEGSSHLNWRPDAWSRFFVPWEVLNAAYMHRTRNVLVKAAMEHLKGKLALIGKGWEQMGLRANSEHAGDSSGWVYAQSQASLNLFGGCVHGGMPLRPFDIAASHGLIVTHYQRELPALFEVGKECVAFRNEGEMISTLDHILGAPAAFNAVALAGRRRVLAEHTWNHRVGRILEAMQMR